MYCRLGCILLFFRCCFVQINMFICLVQEVLIELRLGSRDSPTEPSVFFYYGDNISRMKYRRYVVAVVQGHATLNPWAASNPVFQITLHLFCRWQCFGENWQQIYFGSHTRTLLCSLFVFVLAVVVLAVI